MSISLDRDDFPQQEMPNMADYYEPTFPEFDSEEDEAAYFEAQEDLYEMRELARLDSIHDGDFDWRNGIGQE